MSVGRANGGGALLLNSLFSSVRVDRRNDDNPGLIDQLGKRNSERTITDMAESYTVFTGTGYSTD